MNTMQTDAYRCMTRQVTVPGVPYAVGGDTGEGGNIRESIPRVSRFRTDEPEEKSCVFAMLGTCGGRAGCVSGFVSSF